MADVNIVERVLINTGQGPGILATGGTTLMSLVELGCQADAMVLDGGRVIADGLKIGADGRGIFIDTTSSGSIIADSQILSGLQAVQIDGNEHLITGLRIPFAGSNGPNSAIEVNGDSNTIMACDITGDGNTLSAIEVNGDNNVYVPNVARGTFATAAFIDNGTGNVNTFPNAGGDQGDNIVV